MIPYNRPIDKPGSTHTPRQLYLAKQNVEPTCYNIMRQDIDAAIACSYDGRDFFRNLRTMCYIVRDDPGRKYTTIQIPGTSHPTRLKTLGENYMEDAITRRILQQASELVSKHDSLTSQIKLLRQDLKSAKAVIERSNSVRETVMEVVKEQERGRER